MTENKPQGTARYGRRYGCIKTPKTVSESGEIYVMADRLEVTAAGALICHGGFYGSYDEPEPKTRRAHILQAIRAAVTDL